MERICQALGQGRVHIHRCKARRLRGDVDAVEILRPISASYAVPAGLQIPSPSTGVL